MVCVAPGVWHVACGVLLCALPAVWCLVSDLWCKTWCVVCCAAMCFDVLCGDVLCCAVRCGAVLCCAAVRHGEKEQETKEGRDGGAKCGSQTTAYSHLVHTPIGN